MFLMTKYVWLDSQLVQEPASSLFLQHSGLECGTGVFTTIRLTDGHFEHLSLHIERLMLHARALGLEPSPLCEGYFYALIEANEAKQGVFRVKAQYIASNLAIDTWKKTRLLIYLGLWQPPQNDFLHVDTVFFEPSGLVAQIKTLSRLERHILYMQAKAQGFDEYITLSQEGYLLEGLYSNLFWEYQGTVYTPDPSLPLMHGITVRTLFEDLPRFGYTVRYEKLKFEEIPVDAHLFLCNSLIHYLPILSCAKKTFKRSKAFEQDLHLIKNTMSLL
jgi:4-amino-4-deoxychorismate lyase